MTDRKPKCGFEGAKIRAQDTPTCDDDCTHGRWYVSSDDKKLRCDRICIHTIDNFICPFEKHDTAIRNATLDELSIWAKEQRQKYDDELKRLSKFCPGLRDKPLCVATNSSMCGLFEDKIESLRTKEQP